MTKDVLITISGIQMIDEEDSDVEMIVRGDYYQKNGKHYILYEEMMEGFTAASARTSSTRCGRSAPRRTIFFQM